MRIFFLLALCFSGFPLHGQGYETNALFIRRSVRAWQNKAVEPEKVDTLLRAAMQAPSAYNQQPWEFIVVTNKETLLKVSKQNAYGGLIAKAPLALIVLGNKKRMKSPSVFYQDCAAATQNILLQAVPLGLGGVWIGLVPEDKRIAYLRGVFQLPEHLIPFAVVPLGYPLEGKGHRYENRYDQARVHYESVSGLLK